MPNVFSNTEVLLAGTSRVTKRRWIPANGVQAAGAKPATIGLNGGGWIIWSFADNQEQEIQYNIDIPPDMDLSADSILCVGWSSPTISQDCDWELEYLLSAIGDDTEAAPTASVQSYEESSGTADGLVLSQMATIAGGTITDELCIHCVLMRDGNDANDTLGDVAEVHGVALVYVANKLGATTA